MGTGFLRIFQRDDLLVAEVRANIGGQVAVYDGVVKVGPPISIELSSRPTEDEGSVQTVTGKMTVENTVGENFSAAWELSNGGMGVANWFSASANHQQRTDQLTTPPTEPVQIVSRTSVIGAITIYRPELEALIDKLRALLRHSAEPVITVTFGRGQLTRFANQLLSGTDLPSSVNECTVNISNQEASGNRSITINLRKHGVNEIVVQSPDETWATGTNIEVSELLNQYTSVGTGLLRKHGLDINFLLFLTAILISPELAFKERVVFFVVVFAFLILFKKMHNLVPNAIVYLDDTRRSPLRRQLPTIFSAVFAAFIVWVLSGLFEFLSTTDLREWFDILIGV